MTLVRPFSASPDFPRPRILYEKAGSLTDLQLGKAGTVEADEGCRSRKPSSVIGWVAGNSWGREIPGP
jgi:hypothetical protein